MGTIANPNQKAKRDRDCSRSHGPFIRYRRADETYGPKSCLSCGAVVDEASLVDPALAELAFRRGYRAAYYGLSMEPETLLGRDFYETGYNAGTIDRATNPPRSPF